MQLPIFYAEERPTLYLLERAAKKAGFSPLLFHFRDLELFVEQAEPQRGWAQPSINAPEGRNPKENYDLRARNFSLKKFPLIFVREIRDYQREATLLAKFCNFKKITLIDSALLETREGSKIDGLLRRAANSLPIPKTFFSSSPSQSRDLIARTIKFPLVAKENRSRQGMDVHLIRNKGELARFISKTSPRKKSLDSPSYIFQEFIPCDSDIRLIVVGKKVLGAIERRSRRKNEFRHNIALGACARQIPVSAEMKNLALRAAKVSSYEFAGVDLIRHKKTGKYFILEVNRSPEFEGFMKATGINVAAEVMRFLREVRSEDVKWKM